MPDCQSGAVHSLGCGTIICIAVAGDFSVFVTPIVTRGDAAKPCTRWAAAAVGAPVSFREKETGAGWRNEMAKRIGCCRAATKGGVAAVGTLVEVGIHHIAVSVRAAGR